MQAARALLSPRRAYQKRLRLRRTASGRSLPYNIRFPGQYYQAETGLNQNWNRDYDPVVGRYIEPDPLGQLSPFRLTTSTIGRLLLPSTVRRGYWNQLYGYVDGSPIGRSDARGLTWTEIEIAAKIFGGIGLGAWSMFHPEPVNCGCGHPNWKLLGAGGNLGSAYVIAEYAGPGEYFLYGTGVVAAGIGGWEAGTYLNYVVECDVLGGRQSIGGLLYDITH